MTAILRVLTVGIILTFAGAIVFGQNYKIKQSTSMSGQSMSSTIYVKGARKRTETSGMMGMGTDVTDIEQCDLKRTVKLNDKKKLYYIEPFATPTDAPAGRAPSAQPGKAEKGGTVTMTTSITDTGERKQMFGLTARHIKTVMTMQSSPEACSDQDMTVETDGWYVDLPQFSCPVTTPQNPYRYQSEKRGCTDRYIVKSSGGGKLGFALSLTQTIKSGGDGTSFTQTVETLEFSKAVLEDALFDLPAGYNQANSANDLYGRPDYSAMARAAQNGDTGMPSVNTSKSAPLRAKRPGVIRIGVLTPTNRSSENISTGTMQTFLVQKLTVGNYEGMAVASEADARSADCDYILTSDFSKFKQSTASKIGGILGNVTSTDTSGSRNYDAQVDYSLLSLKTGKVIQNKAGSKIKGDVDQVAEGVLAMEAAAVISAAK